MSKLTIQQASRDAVLPHAEDMPNSPELGLDEDLMLVDSAPSRTSRLVTRSCQLILSIDGKACMWKFSCFFFFFCAPSHATSSGQWVRWSPLSAPLSTLKQEQLLSDVEDCRMDQQLVKNTVLVGNLSSGSGSGLLRARCRLQLCSTSLLTAAL